MTTTKITIELDTMTAAKLKEVLPNVNEWLENVCIVRAQHAVATNEPKYVVVAPQPLMTS